MRTKQNIIAILAVALVSACVCGCTYNELPPKTSDASKSYIKPKGEIPTAEEREVVKAIKAEYEAAKLTYTSMQRTRSAGGVARITICNKINSFAYI